MGRREDRKKREKRENILIFLNNHLTYNQPTNPHISSLLPSFFSLLTLTFPHTHSHPTHSSSSHFTLNSSLILILSITHTPSLTHPFSQLFPHPPHTHLISHSFSLSFSFSLLNFSSLFSSLSTSQQNPLNSSLNLSINLSISINLQKEEC